MFDHYLTNTIFRCSILITLYIELCLSINCCLFSGDMYYSFGIFVNFPSVYGAILGTICDAVP